MKIMTYNVLYGFNHGKSIDKGVDWIAEQKPDVLALQELNGFTQQTLSEAALRWGHKHAVILKENGFPVGLTANVPIEVIEKRTQGLNHGYLHGRVAGIHFFVVHLHPHSYLKRMQEADIIIEKVKALLNVKEQVIVLGDFNAFSSTDSEIMQHKTALRDHLKKHPNLEDGDFHYGTMEKFQKIGLHDIGDSLSGNSEAERYTIPSTLIPFGQKGTDYYKRIDYMLLSPDLVKQSKTFSVIRNEATHKISDHFPLVLCMDYKKK